MGCCLSKSKPLVGNTTYADSQQIQYRKHVDNPLQIASDIENVSSVKETYNRNLTTNDRLVGSLDSASSMDLPEENKKTGRRSPRRPYFEGYNSGQRIGTGLSG
eukprot:gene32478-42075_t